MCGINGLIFKDPRHEISHQLKMMNDLIIHRGPDDDGVYLNDKKTGMGMRRLSIIDLEHGKQPISDSSGDIVIVFNGEIYNYKELKFEQELKGVQFKTQSDTEVILSLYETYGESCLRKLNGMFAFSIHDKRKNVVFIARDRFGEKPLYYHHDPEKFVWASELKSIISQFPELKEIDKKSLHLFFALTYIPAPHTVYQDVYKLPPGYYMTINTNTLEKQITQYWDIELKGKPYSDITYDNAKVKIRELLFESVEMRMIADVPLGVFLSGGVDSTIIASIMAKVSGQKVKTFSVGYQNKKYDESKRAKIVADHIQSEHHEYTLDYNDLFEKVDEIILNYDEPYADSSCLPTYFVAKKTSAEVKVALTGDGGDEVFGGYNKYMAIQYRRRFNDYMPGIGKKILRHPAFADMVLAGRGTKSVFTKARRFINSLDEDVINSHLNIIALGFQPGEIAVLLNERPEMGYKELLSADLKQLDPLADDLKVVRYIDKNISLEGDLLVKVDRASMLCSLECRAPFLDHRLMELTYKLPDKYLIDGGNKKRILKDTFKDLLPAGFFNAPKSGFEVPVGDWFRGGMKQELDRALSVANLQRHGLLNSDYVRNLFDEHISFKGDHSWKLWALFCFQKWYLYAFNNLCLKS